MKKLVLLLSLFTVFGLLAQAGNTGTNRHYKPNTGKSSCVLHSGAESPAANLKNTGPVDYIRLRIHDGTLTDEIIVRYLPLATDLFDSYYDAFKILGFGTQWWSTTYADTSIYYSINALGSISSTPNVPICFRAGAAGTFSISAHEFRSFPPTINITLEDLQTNTIKDLRVDSVYTFTGSPTDNAYRFVLHFSQCTAIPVSVSIDQGTSLTVCSGTNVALSTTGSGGGLQPAYQWYLNGIPVGGNTYTYSNANLHNGDKIYCKLTSSAVCAGNNPAYSDTMSVTVNPIPAPLSITINQGNALTICAGTSVTFTTTQTGGGNTPAYQWFLNGNAIGSGLSSLTLNNIINGDHVWCRITTSAVCAPLAQKNSDTTIITVNPIPPLPVSVSIDQGTSLTVCAGTTVLLTTTTIGGGTSPAYQWFLNGIAAGTGSSYSNTAPNNGDQIYCRLSSSDACAVNNPAFSDTMAVTVTPIPTTPLSVSITQGLTLSICSGAIITFTTTETGGGSTPSYQWYQNGNTVGTNNSSLTLNNLQDGDKIVCRITTSEACALITQATSDTMTVTVNPLPAVPVSVNIDQGTSLTVCAGNSVALTTTGAGGGSNPGYQWFLNGNLVANTDSYINNAPQDGDRIWCVLTSSDPCAFNNPSVSDTMVVTVNPIPVNPVSVSIVQGTSLTVCSGFDVSLSTSQSGGGITPSYQWYLNGTIVGSNNDSLTLNTLQDGDKIFCRITTSDICAVVTQAYSDTLTVTVLPTSPVPVSVAINQGTAISICEGTTELITASGTGEGTNPVYEWYINGNPVGINNDSVSLSNLYNGDIVICKLTSSEVCINNNPAFSDTLAVTVIPTPPTPTITQFGNDLVSDALTGNQWYDQHGPVAGATDQVFTPTVDGFYYVIVTEQGCSSSSSNTIHVLISGMSANSPDMMLELLPNPNKGDFVIFTPKTINKDVQLEIFSASGKKVFSKKLPGLSGYNVNMPELNVGVYYLNVSTADGQSVLRFVVNK